MNLERLNQAIAVMKRAGKVNMRSWQGPDPEGRTRQFEADMHQCGNSACFAGWLALSPEFQEAGGFPDPWDGHPRIGDASNSPALTVAEWLGAKSVVQQELVVLLVYGKTSGRGRSWAHLDELKGALTRWGVPFEEKFNRIIIETWADWGANEVIFYLERLKEEVKTCA